METKYILREDRLQVPCRLVTPDFGDVQRIVLGVHGFTGSMNDPIQTGLAEEMALFRAATVSFDMPAHGENPEDELTLRGCVESLLAVARDARQRYPQVEDLCIFATGFGAYVTLLALSRLQQLPGKIKLVIQTPCVLMHQTLLSMIGLTQQTLRAMDTVTLPTPRPLIVSYRFYKELANQIALTTYTLPMLILHSQQDDYIPAYDVQQFHRINESSKLVTIPGTSHRFLEEGAWDMVLDLTRDWFEFEQVLLADWD